MTPSPIHAKLLAIMADVEYIQKDKENTFHKYTYASEAAIKRHLHAALVKHGVVFALNLGEITERPTGKDGKEMLTTVRVIYRFTDVESGTFVEGPFAGTGADNLDKGLCKAITGAIKYILTSTFLIETGDDPEAAEEKPAKPETPKPAPAGVGAIRGRPMRPVGLTLAGPGTGVYHVASAEPPTPKAPPATPAADAKKMVEYRQRIADYLPRLGTAEWDRIMQENGAMTPAEIKDAATANKIGLAMKAAAAALPAPAMDIREDAI